MKTTVSVIKADIGSVSGHCVARPELMDIFDEVLKRSFRNRYFKTNVMLIFISSFLLFNKKY